MDANDAPSKPSLVQCVLSGGEPSPSTSEMQEGRHSGCREDIAHSDICANFSSIILSFPSQEACASTQQLCASIQFPSYEGFLRSSWKMSIMQKVCMNFNFFIFYFHFLQSLERSLYFPKMILPMI